ncbi:hypothetical protein L218DRAFT_1082577, partial [Marasmius fiardii PR-910]
MDSTSNPSQFSSSGTPGTHNRYTPLHPQKGLHTQNSELSLTIRFETAYHALASFNTSPSMLVSTPHGSVNPTDIPSVPSAPRDNLTDIEFAYSVMVHYNPSSHLGLMVSDSCSFYMPSIIGLRMYLKLAPVATESDKNFGDTTFRYHKLFVTVAATNGLYPMVIAYKNLTINPNLNLDHCTKADVQNIFSLCSRLASMGVTVAMMDSLYPWALQYCIDVCSRPIQLKAPIRRHYAEIFINVQHRLMFYPLPTPPDATYGAPDHWKADHITEY